MSKKTEKLSQLVHENTRFFFAMNNVAEKLHGAGHISAGLRTILLDLEEEGPKTVPDMAHLRNASRQYVQSMVNHLHDRDLVAYADNPRHKRSKLVALTEAGRLLLQEMLLRETKLGEEIEDALSLTDINTTLKVMKAFRTALAEKSS